MAEGARLESVFTGNRNVGSNPTPSATLTFVGLRQATGMRFKRPLGKRLFYPQDSPRRSLRNSIKDMCADVHRGLNTYRYPDQTI